MANFDYWKFWQGLPQRTTGPPSIEGVIKTFNRHEEYVKMKKGLKDDYFIADIASTPDTTSTPLRLQH